MSKLINAFRERQDLVSANRVLAYLRKHPMAECMLDQEDLEMVRHAQVLVSEA